MINPFAYLLAFVRVVVLIIMMALFLAIYIPLDLIFKIKTPARAFLLRRVYVSIANAILGISTEVSGQPYKGTALYVCNHRSLSDPLIVTPFVDAYVIAKAEVSSIPLLDAGASLTGVIYVKRENKDSRLAVREMMVRTLLNDINVLVYPEGTVNEKVELLEYKSGTFKEAVAHNIPIVPMVLEYHNEKDLWHNRSLMSHFFLQFGKLFTKTKLVIGPPMTADDGKELRDKVMLWTQDQIYNLHKGWGSSMEKLINQQ